MAVALGITEADVAASKERLEQEQKEREELRQQRRQQLDEERSQREQYNQAQATAGENCKPTPTQAENDALRIGAMDIADPKEPDGSPEETEVIVERVVRPMPSPPGAAYQTRTVRRRDESKPA